MTRSPFPLQWPDGWARTTVRATSRFSTGMSSALKRLRHELKLLGTANVVITSDLPTRASGMPYGDAADPGIAVWFVMDGAERVFACDRWRHAGDNVHAVALSIAALRGLDRWGASDMVSRAFAGFAALPAPTPSWIDVLQMTREVGRTTDKDSLLRDARRQHRHLMRLAHPDVGGTHETAVRLNNALEEAERELTTRME